MKRKALCVLLAFCCLVSSGCRKVEDIFSDSTSSSSSEQSHSGSSSENPPGSPDTDKPHGDGQQSSTDSDSSSSSEPVSSGSSSESESSSSSSAQQSTPSSSSSSSSSKQSSSSSSSSSKQSSSSSSSSSKQSSSSSSSSSKQSSSSSSSSSKQSSSSSSSSSKPTPSSSQKNEDIPPEDTTVIGSYGQRNPTEWEIEFANEVFRLTNLERVKAGLPEFKRYEPLDKIAEIRAWECLISYSSTHTRPDGRSFDTAFTDAGLSIKRGGENIAANFSTPEKVVEAWMNSERHRANILKPDFEYLGVGFYYAYDNNGSKGYRYFWAQDFCTLK